MAHMCPLHYSNKPPKRRIYCQILQKANLHLNVSKSIAIYKNILFFDLRVVKNGNKKSLTFDGTYNKM